MCPTHIGTEGTGFFMQFHSACHKAALRCCTSFQLIFDVDITVVGRSGTQDQFGSTTTQVDESCRVCLVPHLLQTIKSFRVSHI